jgi:hypothetical protein
MLTPGASKSLAAAKKTAARQLCSETGTNRLKDELRIHLVALEQMEKLRVVREGNSYSRRMFNGYDSRRSS